MKTIDTLRAEHFLFSRLLDGLERLAHEVSTDRAAAPADRALVSELIEFFARFVDGLHQDKEEHVLFPRMLARIEHAKFPHVESLRQEHGRERSVLDELRRRLEQCAAEDPASTEAFAAKAQSYVRLQRRHMGEEDALLLPLAELVLRADDEVAMRAGFRRVEREHGASFEPEARRLLGGLTTRFGQLPLSSASRHLGQGTAAALHMPF